MAVSYPYNIQPPTRPKGVWGATNPPKTFNQYAKESMVPNLPDFKAKRTPGLDGAENDWADLDRHKYVLQKDGMIRTRGLGGADRDLAARIASQYNPIKLQPRAQYNVSTPAYTESTVKPKTFMDYYTESKLLKAAPIGRLSTPNEAVLRESNVPLPFGAGPNVSAAGDLSKTSIGDQSAFAQLMFPGFNPNGTNSLTGGTKQNTTGKTKQSFTEERPMPNLRPWVDVANYALANSKIGQIEREQLARKIHMLPTQSLTVRAVEGLSPEILAAQDAARGQIRSEYAGSDPAMNLVAKNVASANRGKMYNEQIAGRAQQLMGERARHDQETRQNQQMAGETEAKNIQLAQDYADYRTGAKTAALDAKAKNNASFLSQMGLNLDTAANFNAQRDAEIRANKRQEAADYFKLSQIAGLAEDERQSYVTDAKTALGGITGEIPTFNQAYGNVFQSPLLKKLLGSRKRTVAQ